LHPDALRARRAPSRERAPDAGAEIDHRGARLRSEECRSFFQRMAMQPCNELLEARGPVEQPAGIQAPLLAPEERPAAARENTASRRGVEVGPEGAHPG